MEKNPPPSNTKAIALSLATCALVGVIGFEAIMEKTKGKSPELTHNFYPYPLETQNEQLRIELNHSKSQMNELKRQLFVRNKAPDPEQIRKLQEKIATSNEMIDSLKEQLSIHEQELANEKTKALTLETSLTALAELIEIQKITKEQLQQTLDQSIVAAREDAIHQIQHMAGQLEETIAKQTEEIDALKVQVETEQQEKESLLGVIHDSNAHRIELIDQLTIERTYDKLKHEALLVTLNETKESLQTELEGVRSKLEHEKRQKDELNQTIAALLSKTEIAEAELVAQGKMAERGATLEDEIAFEKTLQVFEKDRLSQTYLRDISSLEDNYKALTASLDDLQKEYADLQTEMASMQSLEVDKTNVEEALVFEQLINKVALERLKVELDDLAYALISQEHQNTELKQNLDDYIATHEHLKTQLEAQREQHYDKVGALETELAVLTSLAKEQNSSSLEEQQELQGELSTALLVKKEMEEELLMLTQEIEIYRNEIEAQMARLEEEVEEKTAYTEHLENSLKDAENSLEIAAFALETSLEEDLTALAAEKESTRNALDQMLLERAKQEQYILALEEEAALGLAALEEENQTLESKLQELTAQIATLESTHEAKSSSFDEEKLMLESKLQELTSQIATLESTHEAKSSSFDEEKLMLESKLQELTAQIATLESTHDVNASSFDEDKRRLESKIEDLNAHIYQLETAHEANSASLEEDKRMLETKIKELTHQTYELQSSHEVNSSSLEEDKRTLELKLEELTKYINQLETAHEANSSFLEEERRLLELKLQELNGHITQLEASHEEKTSNLEDEKQALGTKLEELTHHIASLETAHEDAVKKHEGYALQLEHSLSEAESSLRKAALALDSLEVSPEDVARLEREKEKLESELEQIQLYLAHLEASHQENLGSLNETLLLSKNKQEAHIQHLEQSLQTAEHSLDQASATLESLQHSTSEQFAGLHKQYHDLSREKELQDERILALEQSLQSTSQDYAMKSNALDEMEQFNHVLSQRIAHSGDLEVDLHKIQIKYQEALSSIEQLQSDLEAKDGSHAHLNRHATLLSTELETLHSLLESEKRQTTDLAYQLAEIQEHYLEAQSKIHELSTKNERETSHIQDLSSQLNQSHEEKKQAESELQHLGSLLENQKDQLRTLQQQRDSLAEAIKELQQQGISHDNSN